ncbi:Aste57867_698 [Aphanomyces stellatus]|uniref:Aste57867_698 protein n=1 Tax=Aphanomyces stellatus TaxID=120398 RepID=A0A485K8I3_9STRA|nr:hypothetical protein As57867_000697 [Aphanomyces stellatus]VFT77922.1 Aste57867_698 [Aphanomyces stellatus]
MTDRREFDNTPTMDAGAKRTALRACMVVSFAILLWRGAVHSTRQDIRDAAHRHPNLLTPADGTFAIWGIIFTWMLAFVVSECVWPSKTLHDDIHVLYGFFLCSSPCATLWMELFVAGYTSLSFVPIFLHWLLLFGAYLYVEDRIEPIVLTSVLFSSNAAAHIYRSKSRADFWLIRAPFTVYWAWVCASATVALNLLVEDMGLHSMSIYVFWCGMWVLANTVILIGTGDVPFACVALWTLVGIAQENYRRKQLVADVVRYSEYYALEVMASVGAFVFAGLFAFLALHRWWRGPKGRRQPPPPLSSLPTTVVSYGTG